MREACAALQVREVVEHIVSFFPYFTQAAPLAGVCTSTNSTLRYPLQELAYLVRLWEEHQNAVWLEQIQQQNATSFESLHRIATPTRVRRRPGHA